MQQAHQQLVQVQPAEQALPGQRQRAAGGLGGIEILQLRTPAERQQERNKGLQQGADATAAGFASGAACHQADTALLGGEHFQQHTAVAVGTAVEDIGGLQVDAHGASQ